MLLSQLITSLSIIESWYVFTTCPCFGHKLYVQFMNCHLLFVMIYIQDFKCNCDEAYLPFPLVSLLFVP